VNLKLKALDAALADANSAISCDRAYAKAYSTKGSVLLLMARKADAIAAYKAGLEACPGDSSLLERLREAERPPLVSSQSAPPGATFTAPRGSSGVSRAGGAAPAAAAAFEPILTAGRILLLVLTIASVLPTPLSERIYALIMWAAAALHVVQLVAAHGTPRLSADYAAALLEGA
jgi:tetratricopeptide (TPR) repeat protein